MGARRSFRLVLAGQFLGALADSALLIVAIAFLMERHAADWATPALRLVFYLSYVALAAFCGPVADALPKQRVLLGTNLVKLAGCAILLLHVHPVIAYGLVGLGAAAHSPAKYGILSEVVGPEELLAANAWIEVWTVVAMLLGVVLGSVLLDPARALRIASGSLAANATIVLGACYLAAAGCAAMVRASPASDPRALARPGALVRGFARSTRVLWRDPRAQASLAATSVLWGAAAALQFIVLRWAALALQLTLSQAALLQGMVAVGMVLGAAAAARMMSGQHAARVLPLGLAMGVGVMSMALVTQVWLAAGLLLAIGVLAGLFVVTMNTLLQQRGLALMHPGQAIAVQHFSENASSLLLLAIYGAALLLDVPLRPTVVGLGLLVSAAMLVMLVRQPRRAFDASHMAVPMRQR